MLSKKTINKLGLSKASIN